MDGVFITKGMGIRIPTGGLTIGVGVDGKVDASLRIEVSLDMSPYWLEIALVHLRTAAEARKDLLVAAQEGNEQSVGAALEREFAAGMQAVTASAVALDALYASVADQVEIPATLVETWRKNRTARHRQVAEVFRRAFAVGTEGFENLRHILKELYKFRDSAVHPPAKFSAPVLHSVIGKSTEWRFVSYAYESAHDAVRGALAVVVQLARSPRAAAGPFTAYCQGLEKRVASIESDWYSEFGALVGGSSDAPEAADSN